MALKLVLVEDSNLNPVPIVALGASADVDGSIVSTQSAEINAHAVRILNLGATAIRVLTGLNPTALATSIAINPYAELWLPIIPGEKVAVLGGIANICSAGF